MKNSIVIVGATSGIGSALARVFASRGVGLILAGRDEAALQSLSQDLLVRYESQSCVERFDALAFDRHEAFFEACVKRAEGELAGVILCHGAMTDQVEAQEDFEKTRLMIDVNYTSAVSVLNLASNYFEQKRSGWLCAVSSVAGDRGRGSNYIYGSAKAGLNAYLQGLRNRLAKAGVPVLTVKPGFVDTAMTWGLVKADSPVMASPDQVARDIAKAIEKKKDVIYTLWFWRWIMLIIKSIPEMIFKRLSL